MYEDRESLGREEAKRKMSRLRKKSDENRKGDNRGEEEERWGIKVTSNEGKRERGIGRKGKGRIKREWKSEVDKELGGKGDEEKKREREKGKTEKQYSEQQ